MACNMDSKEIKMALWGRLKIAMKEYVNMGCVCARAGVSTCVLVKVGTWLGRLLHLKVFGRGFTE